jgi:hypothetical protein
LKNLFRNHTQHQSPKVNLGEKIMALQQIMSPFGKTDTASVLLETITYIKFLHGTGDTISTILFRCFAHAPCVFLSLRSFYKVVRSRRYCHDPKCTAAERFTVISRYMDRSSLQRLLQPFALFQITHLGIWYIDLLLCAFCQWT